MKCAFITDCHLKPEGTKRNEDGYNARFIDRVKSLEWANQTAFKMGAGLNLFGGDLFENSKPAPYQIMEAIAAMYGGMCCKHWIGIEGNHDQPKAHNEDSALAPVWAAFTSASRLSISPEIIRESFDDGILQIVTLPSPRRSALAQAVPGYSEMSRDEADLLLTEALEQILQGLYLQLDPQWPSVLLGHVSLDVATIRGECMEGRDIIVRLEKLPPFTACVLGHIHEAQDFSKYGRPEVFYGGSTDRMDFGEEGQAKYFTLIGFNRVDDVWIPTVERVEIPCREYYTVHGKMDPKLPGGGIGSFDADKCKDAIVRAKITRPESVKPDYEGIRRMAEQFGCFDFYGVTEDVIREETLRAKEIREAKTTEEHLAIWHSSKGCDVPLEDLRSGLEELEAA